MTMLACPRCGKGLNVNEDRIAEEVRCPGCQQPVPIPDAIENARTLLPSAAADVSSVPTHSDLDRPLESGDTHGEPAGPQRELTDFLAPPQAPDELGRLGGYRVLKILGSGGMGVVYKAEDPQLQRLVALKAMLPSLGASVNARQRFLREARAAAALKHDHVVTIHQVGEERGAPFLAMEFLEGEPLDQYLKRHGTLPVAEVLRIGRQVALGLAAAHKRGLIHRDIKPANLWLEAETGRVKILDFGLARGSSDEAHLTQSGAIVGTPAYMAPEQAQGQEVDARADLFSLGCLLYRLCTGQAPFRGPDTISTLMAVATENPPAPRQVNGEVPEALSDLVMQLLSKKPAERPASAQTVIEGLGFIEADHTQPLLASLPSAVRSRAGKAGSRRRWRLWVVAAAMLLLVGGGILLAPILLRSGDQDGNNVGPVAQQGSGPKSALPVNSLDDLRPEQISAADLAEAGGGDPDNAPEGLVAVLGDSRFQHWSVANSVAISPDGQRIASGSYNDQTVKVWDASTGKAVLTFRGHSSFVKGVTFSSDGKRIASASGDKTVKVWDAVTGRVYLVLEGHTKPTCAVAFSPNGKRIASSSSDSTVKLWDAATGQLLQTLSGHQGEVKNVHFSPDGKRLVSSSVDQTIKIWDVDMRREILSLKEHTKGGCFAVFSPDGKRLASCSADGMRVWDADGGTEIVAVKGGNKFLRVAFSPDGKRIAATRAAEPAGVWDTDGKKALTLKGSQCSFTWGLAYSADGKRIVTGDDDGRVRVWDAATGQEILPEGWHEPVRRIFVSRDGKILAEAVMDKTVKLWNLLTNQGIRTFKGHKGSIRNIAWTPDGKRFAAIGEGGMVKVWDVDTGAVVHTLSGLQGKIVALSPDGNCLVGGAGVNLLKVWDLQTGQALHTLKGHSSFVSSAAFSPDGKRIVSGSPDVTVRLWDAQTGQEERVLKIPANGEWGPRFSPDGKRIATGGPSSDARLWDADTGMEVLRFQGHGSESRAFSPDGKSLVSEDGNRKVLLWDTASGKKLREWQLPGSVKGAFFAPDGRHIVTRNANGTVYVLRLMSANR